MAFEPDVNNYTNLVRNYPNIDAVCAGCWDENTNLCINSSSDQSEIVFSNDAQNSVVKVIKLDDIPECNEATFIKMDIEGAEQKAILGARRVIQSNRPKLAICIYHSDEDMLSIPRMLHEMCPDYNFYVRQHSNSRYETVLYCV